MSGDPFATAGVRERVLAGWAAAPVRLREDANAEEDFALGGYRDRVVVELAQNAADAAAREGVPGRLLLAVRDLGGRPTLVAANTGAPLDPDGVQALATLRASAKRGDSGAVGRFGVGFSAVLAVTDEAVVVSRTGTVVFSRAATAEAVALAGRAAPALADEVRRRAGHVPALRLPFDESAADAGLVAAGRSLLDVHATVVLLPLRDGVAARLVDGLLAEVGDPLLLALPALDEVRVEPSAGPGRTVASVADRWHVLRRAGRLEGAALADRPTEERDRTTWSVTWALPRHPDAASWPAVVHSPTPSEDRLPWPALLVATLPLDSSRRHVAPGPATDAVLAHAARAYADLLAERAAEGEPVWPLVPGGLPVGPVDGTLAAALGELLPGTPLLTSAEDPSVVLRPRDAVALEPPAGADPAAVDALAAVVAGLVHAPLAASAALARLGVRRLALADVVDQMPPPAAPGADGWLQLYAALAPLAGDASGREALAGLPVPLADGRVVRGARGAVLPSGPAQVADALAVLGVRAVRADVAGPCADLLTRLGARTVDARSALELPELRAAIRRAADEADAGPGQESGDWQGDGQDDGLESVVHAVLTLVGAALPADPHGHPLDGPVDGPVSGTLGDPDGDPRTDLVAGALAGLPLPDVAGDLAPAADLALPGSVAARLLEPDVVDVVAPDLLEDWGPAVLRAVGVLDGPALVRARDLPLDDALNDALNDALDDAVDAELDGMPHGMLARVLDLDGLDEWLVDLAAGVGGGEAVVAEVVGVRDLDAVRGDAWPEFVGLLSSDPALRRAVVRPVRVVSPTGALLAEGSSYTAWWLRDRFANGGVWADPAAGASSVLALLPRAPELLAGADPEVRRALGAIASVQDLRGSSGRSAARTLLDRLGDDRVEVEAATAVQAWEVLAAVAGSLDTPSPSRVRVVDGAGTAVVDAEQAVVVDAPALLQRAGPGDLGSVVLAPGAGAAEALADLLDLPLASELVEGLVTEDGEAAGERADVPPDVLALLPGAPATWCEHEVLRVDGVEVDWWVSDGDPAVHASTLDGLARGLAWAAGAWWRRAAVAEVLSDPAALAAAVADEAFGPGA